MPTDRREHLRQIMLTAWGFRRSEPSRPFADCLRGAWKMIKALAADMARFQRRLSRASGHVQLSPSLIRSPTDRALTGQRWGRTDGYRAGKMISRLGS